MFRGFVFGTDWETWTTRTSYCTTTNYISKCLQKVRGMFGMMFLYKKYLYKVRTLT